MYLNPKIYKIYSVIVLAASVLSAIIGIFNIVSISSFINRLIPAASQFTALIIVLFTVLSLLSLFFHMSSFPQCTHLATWLHMYKATESTLWQKNVYRTSVILPLVRHCYICYLLYCRNDFSLNYDNSRFNQNTLFHRTAIVSIDFNYIINFSFICYLLYKIQGDWRSTWTEHNRRSYIRIKGKNSRKQTENVKRILLFSVCVINYLSNCVSYRSNFVFDPLASVFGTGFAVGCTIGFIFLLLLYFRNGCNRLLFW